MTADLTSLSSRLERLERSNRRAHRVATLAVLALVALPTLSFFTRPQEAATDQPLDVVRGSAIELVDAAGKVRGRLGFDKDGGPELRFFDANAKVRLRMGIHKDAEPIITLVDEDDKNRLALVYDGNPHFVISRPGGKPVIHMTASATGDASLLFTHIDGRHNAVLGIRANGDAISILEKTPPSEDKGK